MSPKIQYRIDVLLGRHFFRMVGIYHGGANRYEGQWMERGDALREAGYDHNATYFTKTFVEYKRYPHGKKLSPPKEVWL